MYLKKSFNRKTGRTQLFIAESYRDNNKKPKARVIKTLGYLDVLEKEYDDPIAHFTEVAREMTRDRDKALRSIRLQINANEVVKGPAKKINFGIMALLRTCDSCSLDTPFNTASTKSDYALYHILRNASCMNVMVKNFNRMELRDYLYLYGDFASTMSDFNRCMDIITSYKEEITGIIKEELSRLDKDKFSSAEAVMEKYRLFIDKMFDMPASPEELLESLISNFDDKTRTKFREQLGPHKKKAAVLYDSVLFMRFIGYAVCELLSGRMDGKYTVCEILESLRKCYYIYIDDDIYMLDYWDSLLDELGKITGVDFTKRFRTVAELKQLFSV